MVQANSGDPHQTPRSAAADLGHHCLIMSHKNDAKLKWDTSTKDSQSLQL